MSYQAVQTRRFARQYKKLHDNVAADVDAAVSTVETSPKIGDQKKGDLAALYVYKFRSQGQLYLLPDGHPNSPIFGHPNSPPVGVNLTNF